MFDINSIKPEDPKYNLRTLKNLRYLLFSLKEKEDRFINKNEEFEVTSANFSKEEISDIKSQIEEMEHFDGWVNFGITYDVVWAGLYVEVDRSGKPIDVFWRPGFHGSDRQLVFPVRLTHVNNVKRMETTYHDTRKIMDLEIPNGVKNEVLKNKATQKEWLERQMIGQNLPGGDTFAKATIKAEKIQKAVDEQKALNDKLKAIAQEEMELKNSQNPEDN